jgi:single stranded DNA-binding protein
MNNCTFIGNLGNDAEIKQSNNGQQFVTYSVCESHHAKDGKQDNWVRCIDFSKGTATLVGMGALKKGHRVAVGGQANFGTYQDNSGNTKMNIDLMVSTLDPGSKAENNGDASGNANQNYNNNNAQNYNNNNNNNVPNNNNNQNNNQNNNNNNGPAVAGNGGQPQF